MQFGPETSYHAKHPETPLDLPERIPDGCRNNTLYSIAGRLHDGTRDLSQLTSDLLAINKARCIPPLPEREVRGIARKMHKRAPCKRAPGDVGDEVRAALGLILEEIDSLAREGYWRGRGPLTDHGMLMALIRLGLEYSKLIPAGVQVSISMRDLALEAGVSLATTSESVKRLRNPEKRPRACGEPWLSRDDADRAPNEAGAIVLRVKVPESAPTYNTHPQSKVLQYTRPSGLSVQFGRASEVPALRWRGLGKKAEAVLRVLVARNGAARVKEIAEALGDKRPRDLLRDSPTRTGAIKKLEKHGIVELRGELVELVPYWRVDLENAREWLGEIASARKDEKLFMDQRDSYDFHLAELRRRYREMRESAKGLIEEHRREVAKVRADESLSWEKKELVIREMGLRLNRRLKELEEVEEV